DRQRPLVILPGPRQIALRVGNDPETAQAAGDIEGSGSQLFLDRQRPLVVLPGSGQIAPVAAALSQRRDRARHGQPSGRVLSTVGELGGFVERLGRFLGRLFGGAVEQRLHGRGRFGGGRRVYGVPGPRDANEGDEGDEKEGCPWHRRASSARAATTAIPRSVCGAGGKERFSSRWR